MSININASAGSLGSFSFVRATPKDAADLIRSAGKHFGEAEGNTITLTFSRSSEYANSGVLPYLYATGNGENLRFSVSVSDENGAYLAGKDNATLEELASMVEGRLSEALAVYPTVVAEITIREDESASAPQDEAPLQDWERELLADDEGDFAPSEEDEAVAEPNDGPVKDAIEDAVASLGGVTLNELFESGVDPLVYGIIVQELRSAL